MWKYLLLILSLATISGGTNLWASSSSFVENAQPTAACMIQVLRSNSRVEDIKAAVISYEHGPTLPLVTFMLKDMAGYVRPIYVELYDKQGPSYLYDLGIVMAMGNDDPRIGDIAYQWELSCHANGVLTSRAHATN